MFVKNAVCCRDLCYDHLHSENFECKLKATENENSLAAPNIHQDTNEFVTSPMSWVAASYCQW